VSTFSSRPPTTAPRRPAGDPANQPASGAAGNGAAPARTPAATGRWPLAIPPLDDGQLGQVLLDMGVVQRSDLTAAAARARTAGRPVWDVLLSERRMSRDQLARAAARRLGLPYFDPGEGVDPAATQLIDERSARRYSAVPVRVDRDGHLVVAMADPTNVVAVDDLQMLTGRDVRPALALPEEVAALLARTARLDDVVADLIEDASEDVGPEVGDIRAGVDDAPVVRLVNSIIAGAVDERASDIHFEPQANEMVVRYRVDGVLRPVTSVPLRLANGVVSRIKIMADLDISERRLPQDGRVGLSSGGRSLDLRVASLPTVHGEKVVIRVLDRGTVLLRMEELGFTPDVLARYERLYRRPYGAVLVTGPTGSGKSTTLYATLNQLNSTEKNVITVEDPVEFRMAGVNQVQVNPKAGLSFAAGLRSILRCDPDIVMIGEIRDRDTAQIAIESALTGHLVLATMHTNDAAGTLSRLTKMGIEPFLTSSALAGVLAQRLARRLCAHCREKYTVRQDALREAAGTPTLPRNLPDPVPVYRAAGCNRCSGTGYKGRMGVYELLTMSEEVERLFMGGASSEEIRRQARREGMRTLREDGVLKVLNGLTSLDELARTVA
jgi:type IV pilus assembly protein PilB